MLMAFAFLLAAALPVQPSLGSAVSIQVGVDGQAVELLRSAVWNKPERWELLWPVWRAAFIRKGLVTVHVPKAGGTSVVTALYGRERSASQHYAYSELASDPELAALPSFAVVRNPYWRFVSAYNYLRAGGQADMPIADNLAWARVLATVSVDELLALLTAREDSGDRRLDALMAEHGAADLVMFLPQSRLLCADSGAGAVLVDSVLRMEEMAASGKVSVPGFGEVVVEHVNPTREKAVTVLSESTAAGIFRLYRRDFAVFGYDQESWRGSMSAAERWRRGGVATTARVLN